MIINLYLLFIIVTFIYAILGSSHRKYRELLCQSDTNFIKGFAILIIMLAHIVVEVGSSMSIIGGEFSKRIITSWGAVGVAFFFFLSGYGNYYSLETFLKNKDINSIHWFINKIIKLIFTFLICLILVFIILFFLKTYSINDFLLDLLTLKMPKTSTWYFKIQIMFYAFLWFASYFERNKRTVTVVCLSFIYIIIANIFMLPDFWWKTALCFPAGIAIAQYKALFVNLIDKYKVLTLGVIGIASTLVYGYLLIANKYIMLPQCFSYAILSTGFCSIVSILKPKKVLFQDISNITLEIYLIHIGILSLFLYKGCSDIKIMQYILLTFVLSFLAHLVINKTVLKRILR